MLLHADFTRPCVSRLGPAVHPKEYFSSGFALQLAGKPARAKELFQKAVDSKFVLADYSLHYLSTIAYGEKNWDQARQYSLQLRQQYPQSIWFSPAELQLIKIDLAEKRYQPAIASLRALRAGKNAKSEILQEALLSKRRLKTRWANRNKPSLSTGSCDRPIQTLVGRRPHAKNKPGCERNSRNSSL